MGSRYLKKKQTAQDDHVQVLVQRAAEAQDEGHHAGSRLLRTAQSFQAG